MTYKNIYFSELASSGVYDFFAKLSEKLVNIGPNPSLPQPIATHADVQMLFIDDTLILTRELYEKIASTIPSDIIIAFSEKNHTDKYPGDVNLNALYMGKSLFANYEFLDPTVKKVCLDKGIGIINVNQGYAKCSSLPIGNDSLITADKGITEAAKRNGIDVLLITPGGIKLEGYDYGFIGGASFYDSVNRVVYFFGDLKAHSDCDKIVDFCNSKNVKVKFCDSHPLIDIGGAVAI